MRPLTADALLAAWEQGLGQAPWRRALLLLAAACDEDDDSGTLGALAELSIGERDRRLLRLREEVFGAELASLVTCPGCGEQLEFAVRTADLMVDTGVMKALDASVDAGVDAGIDVGIGSNPDGIVEGGVVVASATGATTAGGSQMARLRVSVNGYEVSFRLPNSRDLAALALQRDAASSDAESAERLLLSRCVLEVSGKAFDDGVPDAVSGLDKRLAALPAEVFEAVAASMEEADPQANVQLQMACWRCGDAWEAVFDIESFFWSEVQNWATRLLREVQQLARAYGWREADILAMSPRRRQFYLEMANG